MSNQLIIPRAFDATGNAASGAKAYVYETGTATPVTIYTDTALSVPHASPIVANSAGYFAQAFYGGALALRVVVTDSADATLVTYDPVPVASLTATSASAVSFTPTTDIPETEVQSAIESVSDSADLRLNPLENASRLPISAGSSGAYTLTTFNTVSAYALGQEYEFVANHNSVGGGSDTLNVDSLGGLVIKKYTSGVAKGDLSANEIEAGDVVRVKYDGTHFVLVSPGGSDARQFLGTLSPSAASSVDFESIMDSSEFGSYEVEFYYTKSAGGAVVLQTSTDNGANYDSGVSDYAYCHFYKSMSGGATPTEAAEGDNANTSIKLSVNHATASGYMKILNPHAARETSVIFSASCELASTWYSVEGKGVRLDTGGVTAFRFAPDSGTITGTFKIFGIRHT